MSFKKPIGDPNILTRRIGSSGKYEGVSATIDTGSTLANANRYLETSAKPRKGELFRRVKCSTLGRILHYHLDPHDTLQSDGNGVSYPSTEEQDPILHREILLLDVREPEDWEACHIAFSKPYRYQQLRHATNPFTPEVFRLKSKPDAMVILYDLEEDMTVERGIGNEMFQKGVDNVFVLCGGLREFVQMFHDTPLVEGMPPVPIQAKAPQARENMSSRASVMTGSTVASTFKPKSLATSLARRSESGKAWR